jgi:putative pyruvate formate lyase activating enzyme
MKIPVLWNSSAYEGVQALDLLKDHVDIYLPDIKTLDSSLASKFFNAPDYPQTAAAAILKMIDMTVARNSVAGVPNSALCDKVIIRHLVLPGYLDYTRFALRWFAENARGRAMLSLMTKYTPINADGREEQAKKAPDRYLKEEEYDTVLGWLEEYGIEDGFCQELVTGSDWLPDFSRTNPFPSKLSVPVWHWNRLFAV